MIRKRQKGAYKKKLKYKAPSTIELFVVEIE